MNTAKLLVLNCMLDNSLADSFNWALKRPLKKITKPADYVRVPGAIALPDVGEYSHVIISGSEASVLEDQTWDTMLKRVVKDCVLREIPLLGICYGHQFLAQALMANGDGGNVKKDTWVERSRVPEFGWERITLAANPLFGKIKGPVCMVSHYDSVKYLDSDFQVIASTPNCLIHGFQYKDLPVWGVQFHPEYNTEEADEIFNKLSMTDPEFSVHHSIYLQPEAHQEDNEQIILNFLAISR
jgi:GMP synthase (glutamine-hydrolysing)